MRSPDFMRTVGRAISFLGGACFGICLLFAAAPVAAAPPLQVLNMLLMYESEPSGELVLVMTGELPEDVELPAKMLLPLPADARILSAAEHSATGDQTVPAEARQEVHDGTPALVMTLTDSRLATLEVIVPNARTGTPQVGSQYEAGFSVDLPVAVESGNAGVAVPQDGEVLSTDPSVSHVSEPQPDGRLYYFVRIADATAGDEVRIYVDYYEGWVDESAPWMLGLVVLAVAGAAIALVLAQRHRRSGSPEQP